MNLLPLEPGQTLLVNGAAGGVGLAAVQFALAGEATVIGAASEGNHEYLRPPVRSRQPTDPVWSAVCGSLPRTAST